MSIDRRRGAGFTLIELIVFIVIVSVGLAGVLGSLNISAQHSADPLPPKQALAIAEGLLEEVLLKAYANPSGGYAETDPANCSGRDSYDDVSDYACFDGAPATAIISRDLVGNALPAGYSATIGIATIALGPSAVNTRQVTVTVAYPGGSIGLTGYRSDY
jgi:MSHA pilin protein MshD